MSAPTIQLECRRCPKVLQVERSEYDYPEATRMRLDCPDCWNGDFDEPDYFDANGKPVEYDPEEIPAHRAAAGLLPATNQEGEHD